MSHNIAIFFTTTSFKQWRSTQQNHIAFVPTMGNLHIGHIALLELAIQKISTVVLSIFVNPTQFAPTEDFEKYPRTLEQDVQLVSELQNKYPESQIVIYAPKDPSEVYSKNFSSFISPGILGTILEGEKRPGHFQGVCSVVNILLNIIRPHCLYLGKKDYQQWKVLEKMIQDLQLPVAVIAGETVRTDQGLALSSRNSYLSPEQQQLALNFPRSLQKLKDRLLEHWNMDQHWNLTQVENIVTTFCAESTLYWDYCTIRQQDLAVLNEHSLQVVILGVIKINHVRLLDNLELNLEQNKDIKTFMSSYE